MNTGLLTEIFKNVALNNKDFYYFSMRAGLMNNIRWKEEW